MIIIVYGTPQARAGYTSTKNAGQLARAVAILVFLVSVSGIWLGIATYRDSNTRLRADLIRQAQLISESLDPDLLRNLTGTEADLESPSYQRIKQHLILLRTAYTNSRFIYLMNRRDNGEVYFLADSEPPESDDYSPPGQVYSEAGEIEGRMFQDVHQAVDGPTTDRWGTWITAYVVISDPKDDSILALFGIDVAADEWHRSLMNTTVPIVVGMLLLLILLAMAHLAFARRHRCEGAEPAWMNWIEPVCVIAAGLILSVTAAQHTYHRAARDQHHDFALLAASETQQIASRIRALRYKDLLGIKTFIESSNEITPEEFTHYTDALLNDPAVYAWAWIPEVTQEHRAEFIKNAQVAGIGMHDIWVKDAEGQPQAAENKPVYYPLFYINPLAGYETAVGFDSSSEPQRDQAIRAAMRTKLPVCTPPLRLAMLSNTVDSMIVYQPILRKHPGCVAMSLNLRGILPVARESAILHYDLKSINPGAPPTDLISSCAAKHREKRVMLSRPIAVFNDVFLITAHQNAEHFVDHSTMYAFWMLGSGIAITIAVALLVGMPMRRSEAMRAIVTARTSELREKQQFLSDLFEHSGALIYVKDLQGNYELVNRKWEETTGLSRDQALGKSDFDLFPEATARVFVANDQKVMASGKALETEEQLENQAGERHFLSIKFPWRDHQGAVIGCCGVTSEITALKQSEENLRAHVDELQRWHDITIDRESRVLEMKSEVNALLTRLGESAKYENT